MIFKWKQEYELGIKEVDKQHKELFDIGNELYSFTICNSNVDRHDDIKNIIEKLISYSEEHFKYEEFFMESHDYPDLKEHKNEHAYFF
jgi:hemerythrin